MGDETVDPETALDADEAIRNEIRKKIRAKQRVPAFEKAGDSEDTERNLREASTSMFFADFGPPH